MKGTTVSRVVRAVFGIFMVCVYMGMAVMMATNFFDWNNTLVWKIARWAMAVVFGVYGLYRGYRQWKGVDYYRHER